MLQVACLLLAALWWADRVAAAEEITLEIVEAHNSLSVLHETPHTKWARPYAGGRLRVLFVTALNADVNIGPTRVAVEILQRFDIDADAVLASPAKASAYAITYKGEAGVYGGERGVERLAGLLRKPYDCYVVTKRILGHVPADARAKIVEHVKDGAGLVFLDRVGEKDEPLPGVTMNPVNVPAMLSDLTEVQTYRVGDGRAVTCAETSGWDPWHRKPASVYGQGFIFGLALPRDLRVERQGRAILWAAGREPEARLSVSVGADLVPRDDLAERSIAFSWEGPEPNVPMRIATRIRCPNRPARHLRPLQTGGAATGTVRTPLPALAAGRYVLDCIATSERGIEAWTVEELTVTSDERLGPIKLRRHWGEAGEPIEGTVALTIPTPPPSTSASAESARADLHPPPLLRVQAIDRYGRVLVRQEFPGPGAAVAFSLPTEPWMPSYTAVEAVLMVADEEVCVAYAEKPYTIPHRRQDDWNFVMWGRLYGGEYSDIGQETLTRSGITSRLETSYVPFWFMTRGGMSYSPYCTSGLQRQNWNQHGRQDSIALDDDGVLERGCWNDEPAVTERLDKWLGEENDYRRHGVLAYSMGDENETLASCLHPACLDAYREFLRKHYTTIAALNGSWGTSFESFDEVGLSEPGDNYEKAALEQKNYPRWFDRRAFQSWNYANYCSKFGAAARRMDPPALWGPEGAGWLDDDLGLIVRNTTWMILYSIPASEVVRSVAPRGYLYGHWVGYTNTNPKYALSDFWLSFLRGGNSIGWWRVDRYLAPHYGLSTMSGSREVAATARVVFDGLGKLLNVKSEMQHDGIAMLHSFASAQAASHLEAGPSYGTYSGWLTNAESESAKGVDWALKPAGKNHFVWHRAIRAVGLQFEYVTDRMLRRGEFAADEYRVLLLSQCEAIGPAEAEVIRRFAQNGGTVVADIRPGLYDGHCKPRGAGALDDLFGVRHTGNVEAIPTAAEITGAIGGRDVELQLPGLHVNPAVRVTTGSALGTAGETPVCIVNKVGKGQAILLNFPICTYPNLSLPETDEAAADLLDAIFASAGITWPLRVLDEEGNRRRNTEVVRWQAGDGIEVAALYRPLDDRRGQWRPDDEKLLDRIRAHDVEEPVRVQLPAPKHVRQLGGAGAIGRTRSFTVQTRPWQPTFVVLTDEALGVPVLHPARRVARRGSVVRFQVAVPDARGLHALKVRVTTPNGGEARWFDRSVVVGPSGAEVELPVAFNEQSGDWTVAVTDLYSGETATGRLVVEYR